ncbi:MAG: site-2 protease family protein [Dehalococcoidia bacterium]|nr:site-2 protease family protein [Dehalococcoidia bacterium]
MNRDPYTTEATDQPSTLQLVLTALAVVGAIAAGLYFEATRQAFTSGLLFLTILVGLVLAHEFGHFLTAKAFGVQVLEFGVGFPPRVFGKRLGETEYTLNWLPIGGFVRLLGEEDGTHPRSLAAQARWKRLVIIGAGAVVNLLLPPILFAIAFMIPHEEAVGRAVISAIVPGSPAEAAGFQRGDIILEVAGRDAKNVATVARLVRIEMGHEITVTVKRGDETLDLPVEPRWAFPANQGPTGITIGAQYPFTEPVALPPWEALPAGVQATSDTLILARNQMIGWFRGGSGPGVAGPVGIAQATGEAAKAGVPPLFELAALLSINLGIVNLLPLPALDGGRIFFLLLEVVRGGRRVAPQKEALVHLVGFVAFILLTIVVTFADISRLLGGES